MTMGCMNLIVKINAITSSRGKNFNQSSLNRLFRQLSQRLNLEKEK